MGALDVQRAALEASHVLAVTEAIPLSLSLLRSRLEALVAEHQVLGHHSQRQQRGNRRCRRVPRAPASARVTALLLRKRPTVHLQLTDEGDCIVSIYIYIYNVGEIYEQT